MATLVGTQKSLVDALDALLELDYDAIEAYRAAIDRLDDESDKANLRSFLEDHRRHTTELAPIIVRLGGKPAAGPDVKQWLTKGKVVILGLAGDNAVLLAMKTNEEDTNTAYERVVQRDDLPSDVRPILERNFADERRHKAWIEARLSAGRAAHAHP
jgi:uncharacterized protein (TIGR02284 family)